ncbi:outer membrane protein assembly factor BamC [Candidatus Spongiihabitans sp.]|uniref:outer membrane protein assembly factor BamC n=1 Tax=Candidatus Spongiihabitans sp. TaxID=3101308 RepID=UPI003C7D4BE4
MIFRILFLTLFGILSASCAFIGDKSDKSTTESGTASGGKTDRVINPKKIDTNADRVKLRRPSKATQRELARAKMTKPLELPPDLVGSSNAKVQANAEPFSETRVLPEVIGVRINKQDEKIWLEIDTNVESAWKTISKYWATNGVSLVDYNPEAGTMETEWIKQEIALGEEGSVVKQLFKSLLQATINRNTSRDKYRLRFERISLNKTAMFVSHRVTARKAIESAKKITAFEWVELPSNPERVADFLQNIILIFDQSAPA